MQRIQLIYYFYNFYHAKKETQYMRYSSNKRPQILFDSLQTIAPRYYSIANSPYQSKLSIAFSCVDFIASNTRKHGLATSFLEIISSQFLFSKETKKELSLNIFPKLS